VDICIPCIVLYGRAKNENILLGRRRKKETMKIKILIVDDHQMFRHGLKTLLSLQKDMEIVGEAENGMDAVSKTQKLHPDVILMDVNMPVMDGVESTRRILAEMPDMKILALSMCADTGCNSGMMSAGARGYILKGGDFKELTAAIRATADSGNSQTLQ
jgi:DNA-binding NarL/FixJ family response regulator